MQLLDGSDVMRNDQNFQESGSGLLDAEDAALMRHLNGLIKEHGLMGMAKVLGINNKTITRNVDENRVTPRLRKALELEILRDARAGEKKSAHDLEKVLNRLDTLESRMESLSGQEAHDDEGADNCACALKV